MGQALTRLLERRFIFFPTREVPAAPTQLRLPYEDVYFTTEDGLRLHGWYLPGSRDITWLWFHGNAGNIGHRAPELALVHHRLGPNLFIFDYRGYGRSEGQPSERGTYRDARAALQYLRGRAGLVPEKIIYFGSSLGAAVAVELATVRSPLALILVAPFASISDMAQLIFPLLPVHWLTRGSYNSLSRIPRVRCPLLVLHGAEDDTVPLSQGRKLFEAANPPKQFQVIPGAGHDELLASGGATSLVALASFLDALADRGPAGPPTG